MPHSPPDITIDRLFDLLSYDRHTGVFTWRKRRGRVAKPGDEAGTAPSSNEDRRKAVMIGIDGRMYSAARLAWLYVHHEWPHGKIRFRDGNPENLQFTNLYDTARAPSMNLSKAAKYARQIRAINKEALEIIRADPELSEQYRAQPNQTVRMVRNHLRRKQKER